MFRKKEKQSLLEARTKALKEAEKKINNLTKENLAVHNENKDLRFENEEQTELIKRITDLVNSNKYNNEKAFIRTIKELISDYHSQN